MVISPDLAYRLLCMLYKIAIREIVFNVVVDTKTKFDDNLLTVCDKLFGYDQEIKEDKFVESMDKII